MRDSVLAFDVGGTYVKAGIFESSGSLLEPVAIYPARSGEEKEALLRHFTDLIAVQGNRVPAGYAIRGVGLGFPGPFDYERGICRTRGLNKFEALYGVNLKEELTARIAGIPELRARWRSLPEVAIENDAALFALGECAFGVGRGYEKTICLTIGTGFGSAFVSSGQLVKQGKGVPEGGWLYRLPYREGMMDDYISRRGIVRLAREMGIENVAAGEEDVKHLADRARSGESQVVQLFRKFGERLAEVLLPLIRSYQPGAVVIGGQIAQSADLFVSDSMDNIPVRISSDISVSALRGACQLFTGDQGF
ncbi:ROK family protein [Paenibacillus dokdonensis]|uniref:ROK family protein n=1 Tax=Paenibacillus dokdonensis TaxID=2567944 RepID=UPI0010A8BF57|nr:ROK family protein [Paenibacillus dokdonensis]